MGMEMNRQLFGFQWHITNRCNLRCSHCYQDDYSGSGELDLSELKKIADEIVETLSKWGKGGDIAITGGEPLLKPEVYSIIKYLESFDEIYSIDLLSNGTLIDQAAVDNISSFQKLRCVQISLDGGSAPVNDAIRGKGVFEKALSGVRTLIGNNIKVNLMFTLQRKNVADLPLIIDLAETEGINALTIERFVPTGRGSDIADNALTPEEIRMAFEYVSDRANKVIDSGGVSAITRSRPLWILLNHYDSANNNQEDRAPIGGICSAGLDGLCILPDATVLACRRLPIPIGDLKQDTIEKIWFTSNLLWEIREKQNLKGKCSSCELLYNCGGCRAIAYAMTGDYLESDPQCWI